jgi:hypothetical protein
MGLFEEKNSSQKSRDTVPLNGYCYKSVLPTSRNFCCKTQKWPQKNLSGRENPWSNFMQKFQKMAEKAPYFL